MSNQIKQWMKCRLAYIGENSLKTELDNLVSSEKPLFLAIFQEILKEKANAV